MAANGVTAVAYYDKGMGCFVDRLEDAIRVINSAGRSLSGIEFYDSREPCIRDESFASQDVAFVHITDEDWERYVVSRLQPRTLRLRVSTVGFPSGTVSEVGGAIVGHLIVGTSRLANDVGAWTAILTECVDRSRWGGLVQGRPSPEVAQFFDARAAAVLPALSILCQGYLAAYALSEGPVGVERCSGRLREALRLMDWMKFSVTPAGVGAARRGEGQTAYVEKVNDSEYWRCPLASIGGLEEISRQAEVEWGRNQPGFEKVGRLLQWVFASGRREEGADVCGIVADAFVALVERRQWSKK